ncbi:GNAT family N-acetyltransferase [Neobacillus notoginsengisoli]|uniref:GNAT family N-acetyltransferase n=1 Tax=Neobacillus notoginsengisoli TaxID=1578198 RepID=A0A417Z0E0_9BACI|nr:GNAT family N-acetyltransferase [Neobacillus notoginsengisoli]RHW43582.1 GNAT family N-acetyltransferase [Neobacillus notoginsengisoli]
MELTKEKIKIVEYHEGLAAGVAEMWNRSREGWGGDAQVTTAERVRVQEANSENINLFLAMDGELVVGYCGLCEYREDEGALYIPLLNVRTDYHGKKIGKLLVLKALERTVELGWPRLDLYTWPGNTKAVPLYKKCGFFWEDRDDSTHLMNFMPTVLNTEAVGDYFASADWYGASTRAIDVKPDGRKDNSFTYYEYSWKSENGSLRMEFERTGRGLRSIETDDYLVSAVVEDFQLVCGSEYTVTYHIKNKSGKPLMVELEGEKHKNVKFDFKTNVTVVAETTVEAKFILDELEEEQSNWRTHPSVVTKALINGKKAKFAVGILPKLPAKVTGTVPGSQSYLHEKSIFYLDLENNFNESAAFSIAFPESAMLELEEKTYKVELGAKGKTSIAIHYVLKRFGFYSPKLIVDAVTESGLRTTFAKKLGLGFKGPGARFSGECDDYWHIYNGLYQLYLRKFDNRLVPGRLTKAAQKTMGFYPKIGKPYSSEFSKRKPSSVEYREEGGSMVVSAVYESTDFKGLELVSESKLYGEGLLEQSYVVRNLGDMETESPIRLVQPVYHELNKPVFAMDGEIVAFNEKADAEYGLWDSKKLSENWLFSRHEPYAHGIAWPEDASVNFESWYMYVEHELGHIPAGGEVSSEPVTLSFGAYQDWQEFREFATRRKYRKELGGAPVEIQAACREDGAEELILSDRKLSYIDGEVSFARDRQTFYKTRIAQDDRQREAFAFSEKGLEPLSVISAEYEINGISDKIDALVLNPSDGMVVIQGEKREGLSVLTANNGLLSIAASSGFYPGLFSLEVSGREWLDSSFPALAPRAWWNPWSGGIVTGLEGINTKSFANEKTDVAAAVLVDSEGRSWRGLCLSTVFEKNEMWKGLGIHQYFCMLPGVPVLVNVTKLSQHSGTYLHHKNWFSQMFFKHGWVKNAEGTRKYHAGKAELMSYLSGHAVVGSEEFGEFLQVIADREAETMETYMNKEVMFIAVDREIDLAHGSDWLSAPSFIVSGDRVLTRDEVKVLQKLTFKVDGNEDY